MLAACAGRPMLLALTVVGRVALTPAEPLDAQFAAAFNDHQRRGRPARPGRRRDAVGRSVASLVRPSPWHLDAAHADLVAEWLGRVGRRGVRAGARAGRRGRATTRNDAWRRRAAGELAVTVDHADLLVLP